MDMDIDNDQPNWFQHLLNQFQLQFQAAFAPPPVAIEVPAPTVDAVPALQQFTGNIEDADLFLQQASDALIFPSNDFQSKRQHVIFVTSHFADSALNWYHGLQDSNFPCLDSLDSSVLVFCSRFGDPDPSFTAYQKLKVSRS
ncbi:hypothetical protein FRC01_005932 [Tulasnella sp. 417]|nr:hypothetical protein FRC01_005932 [Tulasnella sp. 417]